MRLAIYFLYCGGNSLCDNYTRLIDAPRRVAAAGVEGVGVCAGKVVGRVTMWKTSVAAVAIQADKAVVLAAAGRASRSCVAAGFPAFSFLS
jgi:hypothetical protein